MTTEEKAKRYEEAFKIARNVFRFSSNNAEIMRMEELFPELKESEGEKIRKELHIYLDWLDGRKDYAPRGEYSIKAMIAWLEKQGDNKTSNKTRYKFKCLRSTKENERRKFIILMVTVWLAALILGLFVF